MTLRYGCIAIAVLALVAASTAAASAQTQSQNPIYVPGQPAPVPAPPPPPPSNPQPPGAQPRLDTFGDRVIRCQHYGGTLGLPPGQSDAYVRGCANN